MREFGDRISKRSGKRIEWVNQVWESSKRISETINERISEGINKRSSTRISEGINKRNSKRIGKRIQWVNPAGDYTE